MGKTLVIIEAVGKVQKLKQYLPPGYDVVASSGHIMDLSKTKCNRLGVDVDNEFQIHYDITNSKSVAKLKEKMRDCSDVLIATDPDREGEMIGWSIAQVLKLNNPMTIKYQELTKKSITEALENPIPLNHNLIEAQKTRRVLDRLLGYRITPLLWEFLTGNISAGRVQSVVVKLIIDKELEIEEFFNSDIHSNFKVKGDFDIIQNTTLNHKFNYDDCSEFLHLLKDAEFTVSNINSKDSFSSPGKPFNTFSLQKEANQKLGFSVSKTMSTAQKLYQSGYITYHRTDSVSLSPESTNNIRDYILTQYGDDYHQERYFQSSSNSQEGHLACQPTYKFLNQPYISKLSESENRLYNLIWKRTIGSQMTNSRGLTHKTEISISNSDYKFIGEAKQLLFPGYLVLSNIQIDDNPELLTVGSVLTREQIIGEEMFKQPPKRYSEGLLVEKLNPDNLNIGRPATIGSIIEKIQSKHYCDLTDVPGFLHMKRELILQDSEVKEEETEYYLGKETKKFVPTEIGKLINTFLSQYFSDLINYDYTAHMENLLDAVADGSNTYLGVIDSFYNELMGVVSQVKKENVSKHRRYLGENPDGHEVYASFGRYGPIVYIEGIKYKVGPIKHSTLEDISLEEALEILEYPKFLGKIRNAHVLLKMSEKDGIRSYYVSVSKNNYSVPNENVTLEEVKEIVAERKSNTNLNEVKDGDTKYTFLNGPYGYYFKVEKKGKKTFNVALKGEQYTEEYIRSMNDVAEIKEVISKKFSKGRGRKKMKK